MDNQTASSSNPNQIVNTFERRKGTVDVGHDYEEYTTANFIVELIRNDKIDDFHISVNDANYGKFDDIVVDLKTKNEIFAFQLKHKDKFKVTIANLKGSTKDKDFSLQKYVESMKEIKGNFTKLILYTNSKFKFKSEANINFSLERIEKVDGKKIKYEICKIRMSKHDQISEPIQVSNCFKFDIIESKTDETTTQNYRKFFDCFLFCPNQISCQTTEKLILEIFKNDFYCGETECNRFKYLLKNWCNKNGVVKKLDKLWMKKAITLCIVSPRIQTITSSNCYINKEMELLQKAISEFSISQFQEKSLEKLRKLWPIKNEKLDKMSLKEINQLRDDYYISSTYITDVKNIDKEIKTQLLWLIEAAPLILKHDEAVEKAIGLYPDGKYIILSNKIFNQSKTFQCLQDVKSQLFDDISKIFKLSLQDKNKISIADFCENNKKLLKFFSSDILLQIAIDGLNVGGVKEDLPEVYIDRILEQILIKFNYIINADKNTLIIISGINERPSNLKCELKIVENCSFDEFEEICKNHQTCTKFQYFKLMENGDLLLEYSKNTIKDLKKYRITIPKEEKSFWNLEKSNHLNIVLSDPGMGKSELMKSFKNSCHSKYWIAILNSNDIKLFLKKNENLIDFFIEYKSLSEEEIKLLKLLDIENRIIYVWDGVDEISDDDLDKIIKIVLELKENNKMQWITGRRHLKPKLELKLGLFAMDLTLVTEKEQQQYITKRLSKNNSLEKVNQALEVIKKNFVLINHINILGIPLQLFMITELFKQNIDRYLGKDKTECTLTHLYSYFIDEKFQTFWREKNRMNFTDLNESMKSVLNRSKTEYLNYCQKLSIKLIFPEVATKFHIDFDNLIEYFKELDANNAIGIITEIDINSIRLIHLSFAEYFAACYLEKYKTKINSLKEIIFAEKYENVRFFLDLLLAENCPAHVSILYRDYDKLIEFDEEVLRKEDKGGRNVLHLMSSWSRRHPLFTVENNIILKSIDNISIDETINEDLEFLRKIKKINNFSKDSLFELTPSSYAINCSCFRSAFIVLDSLNNADDKKIANLLIYAIIYGDDDNLHLFQNTNFLDLKFHDESTLLHLACRFGHLKIIKRLIEYGASVNKINKNGKTPLHFASKNIDVVDYLLKCGAGINQSDAKGRTILHFASVEGCEELVLFLVKSGATIESSDLDGRTPAMLALLYRYEQLALFLIKSGTAIEQCDSDRRTLLHLAAQYGCDKVVQFLIDSKANVDKFDSEGQTPLHLAAAIGRETISQLLIESGANINQCNSMKRTPLHLALMKGNEKVAEYLMQAGGLIDHSCDLTLLHLASMGGCQKIVQHLIQSGVDINQTDSKKQTALHWALIRRKENIAQLLIDCGADINQCDAKDQTPLHLALRRGYESLAQYSIHHSSIALNQKNYQARTLLHLAAMGGCQKVAQFLIESGVEVNNYDSKSRTPLHLSVMFQHEKLTQFLIKSGARINEKDFEGKTPLHIAVMYRYGEMAQCLIESGAAIDEGDCEGRTPLHLAYKKRDKKMIKLLLSNGANENARDRYNLKPIDFNPKKSN